MLTEEDERFRVVTKYTKKRQRLVLRGASAPAFSPERALIFHLVPDDFAPSGTGKPVRPFAPSTVVRGSSEKDWKRRHNRHGYRLDLSSPVSAFVTLLRSGAVEFAVRGGTEAGLTWPALGSIFADSLYELADYVWEAPSKPQKAYLSLLVTDAAPNGIVGLPNGFTQDFENKFEETTLRLGPLILEAQNRGSAQFQPMFDLLFQCAGFKSAPSIRGLAF